MRDEDSFNSKQTNEYMADLLQKHKKPLEESKRDEDWEAESCESGDTAKLSFSKEDRESV